jgi:hypothetical protein
LLSSPATFLPNPLACPALPTGAALCLSPVGLLVGASVCFVCAGRRVGRRRVAVPDVGGVSESVVSRALSLIDENVAGFDE